MSKPVRIREHVASRIDVLAESESRSFANMVEVLLEGALEARGNVRRNDEVAGRIRVDHVVSPIAPKSLKVSPADVAATVPGVQTLRPHMRKDKPALQCEQRIMPGEVCAVCGQVL